MGFFAIVGVEICGKYGREQGDYIDHEEEARNTIITNYLWYFTLAKMFINLSVTEKLILDEKKEQAYPTKLLSFCD